MKIEIYGIPESLHKCYGCIEARKLLDEHGLEYEFYSVLKPANNSVGFDYDHPALKS
ncbi:glutaredoxin [Klebsiella phage CPRSA]|nr:glutaredoxin [Klebsiella phage CPRSA]